MSPDFDLPAYLARIGCDGVQAPTQATLTAVCAAHPAAIPFENIDPLLGRPPSLRLHDLQAKLIGSQRGGYCFEHNALLRQALLGLGFRVTALAARVVWMAPPSLPMRPRTHMLLMVDLPPLQPRSPSPPNTFIVDAGFGGHLMNVPLRLEPGLEQASPAGCLRITQTDALFTIETRLPDGWQPLYRFTLDAQQPVDYEPLNWFTATHPLSIFRHNLLMERLTPTTRANLLNDKLTLRNVGEPPRVQRIASVAEFDSVMGEVFGVRLPMPAEALFERVPKGLDGMAVPPP
jgi:N-hydroxyarylamine O-acetyltransferase